MGLLDGLRRLLPGQPTDRPETDPDAPGTVGLAPVDEIVSETVAARQERAAERLLDDERLRGSLTDEQFQPLLDWGLAIVDRVAAATAGDTDERAEERIDAALADLRDAIATIDRMAESSGAEPSARVARVVEAVTATQTASEGRAVAHRLSAALGPTDSAQADRP